MVVEDEIRRLVKSVYKPVAMPPEFKKRLLECLMREVAEGKTHHKRKFIIGAIKTSPGYRLDDLF